MIPADFFSRQTTQCWQSVGVWLLVEMMRSWGFKKNGEKQSCLPALHGTSQSSPLTNRGSNQIYWMNTLYMKTEALSEQNHRLYTLLSFQENKNKAANAFIEKQNFTY